MRWLVWSNFERERLTVFPSSDSIISISATPVMSPPSVSNIMLHTADGFPGMGINPSVLISIRESSFRKTSLMISSPTGDTRTGACEIDFLDRMRCVASAMFLPTPPGERNTEPGVVECKEWVASASGCLRALDVISIAAEPIITKGEGDPG